MNRAERREAEARAKKHTEALIRANKKLAVVETTYREHDVALHNAITQVVGYDRVPCKIGCAHCCEQMVLISIPEGLHIALRYPEVVREVWQKLDRHEKLAKTLGINNDSINIYDDSCRAERDRFHEAWWNERETCAFLDAKTKTCRIYDARPLACRNYVVTDHPPEVCGHRRSDPAFDGTMPKGFINMTVYGAASTPLEELSNRLVGGVTVGPLFVMVLMAYERRAKFLEIMEKTK